MRIALANNTFEPFNVGGAERSMLARAKGLARRGHQVRIFSLAADGVPASRNIEGIEVEYIGGIWTRSSPWHSSRSALRKVLWHMGPEWIPHAAARLSTAIEAFEPDVANFANLPGIGYGNIADTQKLGVPVVMTIADFTPLCAGTKMYRGGRECLERCVACKVVSGPRLARFNEADRYVFVSEFMRGKYERLNPEFQISRPDARVIFNGLDESFLRMDKVFGGADAQRLSIGYLGQLKPTKGVELLIDAFKSARLPPNATLLIAGKGEPDYVGALQARAKGQSRIRFVGWRNAAEFLTDVDLVVVPSVWAEPLSRVGYEANFFRCPIIVSNRGGCPELVEEGRNGSVFDPNVSGALAQALEFWADRLEHEKSSIGEAARSRALRHHHPDVVAGKYEKALTFNDA